MIKISLSLILVILCYINVSLSNNFAEKFLNEKNKENSICENLEKVNPPNKAFYEESTMEHENYTLYMSHETNTYSKEKYLPIDYDKDKDMFKYLVAPKREIDHTINFKEILTPNNIISENGHITLYFEKEHERRIMLFCKNTGIEIDKFYNSNLIMLDLVDVCLHNDYISFLIIFDNYFVNILQKCQRPVQITANEEHQTSDMYFNTFLIILLYTILLPVGIITYQRLFFKEFVHVKALTNFTLNGDFGHKTHKPIHEPVKQVKTTKKKKMTYSLAIIIYILIGMFIGSAYGEEKCDIVYIVSNTIATTKLDYGNGTIVTSASGNVIMTIPSDSWNACIQINDGDQLVGLLRIKISDYHFQTRKELQYYTSCWSPIISSLKQCHGKGGCGKGVCGGIKPTDTTCQGQMSNEGAALYPGESGCMDPVKNIDVGCYLNPTSTCCLYYRTSIIPRAPYFAVYTVTGVDVVYKVEAFLDGKPITIGDSGDKQISYRVDGTFVPDTSILGRGIVYVYGRYYDMKGAERGNPNGGHFGDVQAATENDLAIVAINRIKYAPGIWNNIRHKKNGNSLKVDANYLMPGCGEHGITSKDYPLRIGDNVWTPDTFGTLYAFTTRHDPITMYFNIPASKGLSFTRIIKVVCPKLQNIKNLVSCRNCLVEASFSVEIMSKCSSGYVTVTNKNPNVTIITHTIDVTNSFKTVVVFYSSALENVKDTICFDKECITIENKLLEPDIKFLINNSTKEGSDYNEDTSDFDFDIGKTFKDVLKDIAKLPFDIWKFILESLGIDPTVFITVGIIIVCTCVFGYIFFVFILPNLLRRKAINHVYTSANTNPLQ